MKRTLKRAALLAIAALCVAALVALAGCGSTSSSASASSSSSGKSSFVNDPGTQSVGTATSVYGQAVSTEPTGIQRVLVIGDDSWESFTPGHSDMMCLLRIDFDNHSVTEVTIPRDTKVHLDDVNLDYKLNWVLTTYGVTAQTIEAAEVYGEPIDFYVKVGFEDLEKFVDHFNGIDANLPYYIDYHFYTEDYPDVHIDAGEQTLDSWNAMVTSRSRTSYPEQGAEMADPVRQYMCRQMMNTLVQLAYTNPEQVGTLLTLFQDNIESNLPLEAQIAWANKLGEAGSIQVTEVTGPFWGDTDPDMDGDWLIFPDTEGWKNLHDAVENGGDLEAAVTSYERSDYAPKIPPVVHTTIKVG